MNNDLIKELEDAHIRELAARREASSEFAIMCAIVFGIGILQLFEIDFILLILIFAPIGIFVGVYGYIDYNKRITKERENSKASDKNRNKEESRNKTKKIEKNEQDASNIYYDGL